MNVSITYDDTLYQLVPKEPMKDLLSRVEDLHEKAWMPWQEAEKLALSEVGIEDAQIDELSGNCTNSALVTLLPEEDVREFTRAVLVYGQRLLSAAPTPPAQPDAGRVPDGYALVPVEPTPEMIKAGVPERTNYGMQYADACYRAMLAAAPKQGTRESGS